MREPLTVPVGEDENGTLPDDWEIRRLDEVTRFASGGTPSKARPEWWAGTVPWVSPKDMKVPRLDSVTDHITEEAATAGSRVVPAKSIFVVVRGMVLAKTVPVAIAERPMAFNQDMKAVIAREGIDPDFLFYAIRHQTPTLTREISTSAHGTRRMGAHAVESLRVALPRNSLEQSRIVEVLRRLEDAVAVQDRTVASLRELKAATMLKLFGNGLRAEPSRETEVGLVPETWRVVKLRELLRDPIRNGHSAPPTSAPDAIRTLTLSAVTQNDFSARNTKMTSAPSERVEDLWLLDGDLLVQRANTIDLVGAAAVYRGPSRYAIFPDLMMRVRVDSDAVAPEVLVEWLRLPWCRSYFTARAHGAATNMPKIDQNVLAEIPVLLPTDADQRLLVTAIRCLDARLAGAVSKRLAAARLLQSSLGRMMSGRLRVTCLLQE